KLDPAALPPPPQAVAVSAAAASSAASGIRNITQQKPGRAGPASPLPGDGDQPPVQVDVLVHHPVGGEAAPDPRGELPGPPRARVQPVKPRGWSSRPASRRGGMGASIATRRALTAAQEAWRSSQSSSAARLAVATQIDVSEAP